ncbi:ABC transporter ATP-binding protein [Nordella sp. HKS 07]|uniref:ATP-binding cassette domain-containing protein n=1 Tax=Nordella sp. HKS 07 TaxID=2712222 RepID=UPI0013E1A4FF|nr:ATP-binding cassette domain-containing protein [Nordella sp. HKS 07]QIG47731.1 ABC transporter ATP-binding protein [Nordella sp. HKS 07]
MAEALFTIAGLHLSLPDLARKPLFGAAPRIEILKGLSFTVPEGAITGIVGESGSGKTSLGRTLIRLLTPDRGRIVFAGRDIAGLDDDALRPLRRDLQVIFQDPFSSLNPRKTVGSIIAAPLLLHKVAGSAGEARSLAGEALVQVGLPTSFAARYPHELSGGQRQRVGIARAVALKPRFILADEIVSGLDVSSQAQILDLLMNLRARMNFTMAFISHDLSVVRRLCDRVIVMRGGEIVEDADTVTLFEKPQHAYTRLLRDSIPLPEVSDGWLKEP